MRLIYFLFLMGAFLGPYAYFGFEKLHFIRLVPFLLLAMLVFQRTKLTKLSIQFIFAYLVYVSYTIFISLLHLSYIEPNDIANLFILLIFVISIITLIEYDRQFFLKHFVRFCWFFITISFSIAFYEVLTWEHLPLSGMAVKTRPNYDYYHLPTVFYANANDFGFIFILTAMFLLYKTKVNIRHYILIALTLVIIYFTDSRLALLAFGFFLLFYFNLFKLKTIVLLLCMIAAAAWATVYFDQFSFDGFSFDTSGGGSLSRRLNLYIAGLKSSFYNLGTGFGVGGYHHYYSTIGSSASLHNDTDPHNFYIELLINSGLYITVLYILINIAIFTAMLKNKADKLIIVQFLTYNLLLLLSSASLFLWPHYLFYFIYVFIPKNNRAE